MRSALFLFAAILFAVGGLPGAEPVKPAEPDPELTYAERLLKEANVGTEGPALVAFFKARTLTPAAQEKLAAAIRQLGDDQFEVRERASSDLVAAGRLALPYLRPALTAKDIEVAGRARRCIEDIEGKPESALVPAAALVIAAKRPEGATEALLGCLPWQEDESALESLFEALVRTGLKDGKADPVVTAAAKDKELSRRAAAAFVLGRADADGRRAATALLADKEAKVRFHAAMALIRGGDKSAMPALLALLTDASEVEAWRTEDLLCLLAGDKAPAVSIGATEAERRKARASWEAWWKENGEKIDLTKVNMAEPSQNLTLIAGTEGRVWECGPDGKPRWDLKLDGAGPVDARTLPGGRVLIAEYQGGRVTERDHEGKILWQYAIGQPVSCQRLPNGNTFIASHNQLVEVTPRGDVVFKLAQQNQIYYGEKLRNGRILYVNAGDTIHELDPVSKEERTIKTTAAGTTNGWASVERLANGHYLVALYSASTTAELDADGKVIWQVRGTNPTHAQRLRNGNTLVTDVGSGAVVEYNREGKEVWSVKSTGRSFHAWRR